MISDPLRKAEEMLVRYIQERKKPLAQLALETLTEIAPNHPRRQEYAIWVADLDQELALQGRIDEQLAAGRLALRKGELDAAVRHLEALRKVDPDAQATITLAHEIEAAEQSEASSADIGRLKELLQGQLDSGQLDAAEASLEKLARQAVPKLTIDFYRKRLAEARALARDQAEAQAFENDLQARLAHRDWQAARDVAHRFGERFPDRPGAAEMFSRIAELESAERRQLSIRQGIATVEQFLAQGNRVQAELALKLLRGLHPDPAEIADLEQRLAAL